MARNVDTVMGLREAYKQTCMLEIHVVSISFIRLVWDCLFHVESIDE